MSSASGVRKVYHGARKVYQGNRKVYHCARIQYQTIADMSVLVVSPGFSLVREILSPLNRWHQEHGLALWGKGHVKNLRGCDHHPQTHHTQKILKCEKS